MSWWKPTIKIVVARLPELTEEKLDLALASLTDESGPWRAIHQLIDTAEENANANAADDMAEPTVMAGYVGGAQHLRMLREELNNRRENGLRLLGIREKRKQEE